MIDQDVHIHVSICIIQLYYKRIRVDVICICNNCISQGKSSFVCIFASLCDIIAIHQLTHAIQVRISFYGNQLIHYCSVSMAMKY